jgi:hypothetical protein
MSNPLDLVEQRGSAVRRLPRKRAAAAARAALPSLCGG